MNKRIKKKMRKQYDDDYSKYYFKSFGFKSEKERKAWVSYMVNC